MNGRNSYSMPTSTAPAEGYISSGWNGSPSASAPAPNRLFNTPCERRMMIQAYTRMTKFVQSGTSTRNNSRLRRLTGERAT